jgi:hypothetical protein
MKKPTLITQLRDPRGPGLPSLAQSEERRMPARMVHLIRQAKERAAPLQISQRPTLPGLVAAARKRFGPG